MVKGLKRTPWTRRHALKVFEKVGIAAPDDAYRRLRKRWVGDAQVPAELKVHIILCGAVCEWLEDIAQLQLIRCIYRQTKLGEDCAIEKVSSSILPNLATDIGSILCLCRAGYDVQARSLVRNFIEKLDLLICVRKDSKFALSYLNAKSFEDSRDFFYKNISGGKLARKAKALFKENYPESNYIYEWVLDEWRNNTSLMLSSAAHANHSVSMISLFPNLGRGNSNAIGLGGHPTNGSNVTIGILLTACMPLHNLFASYPYDEALGYLENARKMPDYRAYHGLLLIFPLVDAWLRDLEGAMQNFPPKAQDKATA